MTRSIGTRAGNCLYTSVGRDVRENGPPGKPPRSRFIWMVSTERVIASLVQAAASVNVIAFPVRRALNRKRGRGRAGARSAIESIC
jgi:hypothetical protein